MTIDRIFLDANVLFSIAYGSPGTGRLLELTPKRHCILFASSYVVEEAKRNLLEPEQIERLDACLPKLRLVSEVDPRTPCPVELPEKDRPVLLAAISAKANYLITGDMLHFGKYFGQTIHGVKICRIRDYLADQENKLKKR
jgi:predicted nucleic acid-binding protein